MSNNLLQTIRIPKNLLVLTERLPQPNYGISPDEKNINDFPVMKKQIKIKKKIELTQPGFGDPLETEDSRARSKRPKKLIQEDSNDIDDLIKRNQTNSKGERVESGEKSPRYKINGIKAGGEMSNKRNSELLLPSINNNSGNGGESKKYNRNDYHSVEKYD